MTDTPPELSTPASGNIWKELFSQANITTGLAVFAVVLAGAPYVMPKVQSFIVEKGMMNRPAMLETTIGKLNEQKQAEALAQMADQAKQAEAKLKAQPDLVTMQPTDPVLGNRNAPIKVFEFLDYNCGVCRAVAPEVQAFAAANPDVVIVIKEFPVITEISPTISAYALAANESGQYEKVHDALMKASIHNEADIMTVLTGLGLDARAIQTRAQSDEIRQRVAASVKLGMDLDLKGTPAFLVNGTLIPSANMKALKVSVAAARAAS